MKALRRNIYGPWLWDVVSSPGPNVHIPVCHIHVIDGLAMTASDLPQPDAVEPHHQGALAHFPAARGGFQRVNQQATSGGAAMVVSQCHGISDINGMYDSTIVLIYTHLCQFNRSVSKPAKGPLPLQNVAEGKAAVLTCFYQGVSDVINDASAARPLTGGLRPPFDQLTAETTR